MASIDKVAIVFSVTITIIGVGITFVGTTENNSLVIPTPSIDSIETSETRIDPFADLTQKVRNEVDKEKIMIEETNGEKTTGTQTYIVDIPAETSSPGCEESNACYVPTNITINVGDTIEWINEDTATHTASSGSPDEGPTFVFNSSLIREGASFEFTFEEIGTFDYYCMIHPWMIGSVSVR